MTQRACARRVFGRDGDLVFLMSALSAKQRPRTVGKLTNLRTMIRTSWGTPMRTRFLNSFAWIVLAVALIAPVSAHADTTSYYASVSCTGNNFVARFPEYSNSDKPDIAGDPSHCALADGRQITLRQRANGDATAY